ncbi:MAG TPA: MATE family efflux transporter [Haliangium sp.]|nr:MATE family efflux transporter [Haliangium sp.]
MSARSDHSALREIRPLVSLGVPTALTQLGAMLMGVVDTLMVGRLGVAELGAASLGTVWIFGTLILGMGLMFGLDPIIAQAHGARDHERVGLTLQQSMVAALIASVPIALSWLVTEPALILFGQSPALAAGAHAYVVVQIPSIPLFLMFLALRQYLQGRGVVMPAFWITMLANGFNALGNWVLIFGHLGLPAMGLVGAAIATALTRGFMFLALVGLVLALRLHLGAWVPWSRRALDARDLGRIFKLGVPVGVQYALEGWAFQIATLFAGRLDEKSLAAHTVVLNLASLSFMLPMGISLGAATHVGNLIGAGDRARAQRAAYVALGLGGLVMILSAAAFVGLRWVLPGVYTEDAAVIALAASILPIGAAFQLFDGVQVVGGGILRGMGNTVPAAVINLVGYYALALPLAAWLAFETSLGLSGVWWGLAAGLAVVSVALVAWVARRGPARVRAPVVGAAPSDAPVEDAPPGAA